MSSENVDLVRRGYAAFSRGDIEATLDLIDEDIVITGQITPDGRPEQGREGLLSNVRRVAEAFRELSYEPLDLIDLEERVLARIRVSGIGREGIRTELNFGQVWTIEGGRAVRVENYTNWDDAVKTAGLHE